jgi:hypothetical protein
VDSLGRETPLVVHHPCGHIPGIPRAELAHAISNSLNSCAVGPGEAPTHLLKSLFAAHPQALDRIFTDILRTGIQPEAWKNSLIIPIPKANKPDMNTPKSWRQIHLLSVFSKNLERAVLARMEDKVDNLFPQLNSATGGNEASRTLRPHWRTYLRKLGNAN